MTDDQHTISDYADRVERLLPGPAALRERGRAELVAHLSDAADAGDLPGALERLGEPAEAAAAFTPLRSAPPAAASARFAAAAVDHLPLVAVTLALFVQGGVGAITQGRGFAMTFPPVVTLQFGDGCVSTMPFVPCGDVVQGGGLLHLVGVPLALAWSIVGLGLVEARTGTTPGKRLRGLCTVRAGLRPDLGTAIVRRLSLLAGPFAWLDWAPFLWGDPRRVLDMLTDTRVVVAAAELPRAGTGGESSATRGAR